MIKADARRERGRGAWMLIFLLLKELDELVAGAIRLFIQDDSFARPDSPW